MTVALEAGLVGRDEQTLCDFYTAVMGFVLVDRLEFDVGTVCKLRRGAARLKLFFPYDAVDPAATVEPWFRPGGWRYAALAVERPEDVDALVAAAHAARGRVLIAPAQHLGTGRLALIADPEGNAWELLAEPCDRKD
jgi:catechol 2,3-dioxygenase-like lactoylglutathione lyase family enzyme